MTEFKPLLAGLGAAVAVCAAVLQAPAPRAVADVCGSVGGEHVDVSGCADPLAPLPPPPPADYVAPPPEEAPPPPPPPAPDVEACADVGRRVSVSGCV